LVILSKPGDLVKTCDLGLESGRPPGWVQILYLKLMKGDLDLFLKKEKKTKVNFVLVCKNRIKGMFIFNKTTRKTKIIDFAK